MSARPARTPAIAGAAQVMQRADDPRESLPPLALIEKALRGAADDAGAPGLLQALDAVIVPKGVWSFRSSWGGPAKALAQRVGSPRAVLGSGAISGTSIQEALDRACSEIAAGHWDVVAIAAGECEHTKRRAQRAGLALDWPEVPDAEAAFAPGDGRPDTLVRREIEIGIRSAPHGFALCETALRRVLGEAPAEHRARIARIWERLSVVAAGNPNAWIQRRVPADEIARVSDANRVVAYPYTKLMTANMVVDQAAALIVCSPAAARRFGVAPERCIFPQASALSAHVVTLSRRDELHRHPGQELATQRALELADASVGELEAIDLYSCFPFAVQEGARALGLDAEHATPPLTVTGGLTFSGGPLNSYVLQSLAATVERLRGTPGRALVTSVGGYFAKFGALVLGNEPAPGGLTIQSDVSDEVARHPERACIEHFDGKAEIESFTLLGERTGLSRALFALRTDAGERAWAFNEEPAVFDAILADEDLCGLRASVRDDRLSLD